MMVCCMLELYLLLSQLFWFSGNNKLYKYLLRELEFFCLGGSRLEHDEGV